MGFAPWYTGVFTGALKARSNLLYKISPPEGIRGLWEITKGTRVQVSHTAAVEL